MSTPFLVFLGFAFSLAIWASSTYLNALSGVARAGLLGSRTFVKVGVPAALFVAFACLRAPAQSAWVYFFAMAAAASLSNAVYVIVLAAAHGLDTELAEAMLAIEELNEKALPLNEWKDPAKLQMYLDKTYGRGKVNAKTLLAERKALQA